MAIEVVTKCDTCGVIKGATNHWWSIWVEATSLRCIPSIVTKPNVKHACGVEHAQLMFSRFLSNGTLEPDQPKDFPHIESGIDYLKQVDTIQDRISDHCSMND